MIQAQQLRIGNWVYFTGNGNNNPVRVMELWQTQLVSDYAGNHLCLFYSDDDLQPIPLTPEILEKCGFEFYILQRRECFRKGKFYLHKTVSMGYRYGMSTHIKYLHQLQNLYFALTNSELTITNL